MIGGFLLVVAAQVAGEPAAAEAVQKFRRSYLTAPDETGKVSATNQLGKVRHARTRQVLLSLLATEPETVRLAAAKALGTFREIPGSSVALGAALDDPANQKRPLVRLAIVRSLGDLGDPEVLDRLHDLFGIRDFELAREAILACGKIGRPSSIPILIRALKSAEKEPESMSPPQPALEGVPGGAADEEQQKEQARRREILRPALLQVLRKLTGRNLTAWRDWDEWRRKTGK